MITLPEIPKSYRSECPQIDERDVRILWHCSYYDGPRDGVLLYRDRPCWFQITEDDDFREHTDTDGERWLDWYVRFVVIELSDEQFEEEKYWNDLFREKVGTNWDYNELGKRIGGVVKPKESWDDFYKATDNRKPRDYSDNLVVGWFEMLWASVEVEEE